MQRQARRCSAWLANNQKRTSLPDLSTKNALKPAKAANEINLNSQRTTALLQITGVKNGPVTTKNAIPKKDPIPNQALGINALQ
jgi:hypothetical protein